MGVTPAIFFALALVPVAKTGAAYDAEAHRLEARGVAAADPRVPSAETMRLNEAGLIEGLF